MPLPASSFRPCPWTTYSECGNASETCTSTAKAEEISGSRSINKVGSNAIYLRGVLEQYVVLYGLSLFLGFQ